MNSFQTDKKGLAFWIRGLTLRYWESLGKCEDFLVQWEDTRKNKIDEIQLALKSPHKQPDRENRNSLLSRHILKPVQLLSNEMGSQYLD